MWHIRYRLCYALAVEPIPDGMHIDHACREKRCLNPRHLRPVTNKQNQENRRGPSSTTTSNVLGVSWNSRLRRWVAKVVHHGHTYYGGSFPSVAEAEACAVELRLKLFTFNDADRAA